MLSINRLLLAGLLSLGIGAATTAQAGNQLFEASWTVKSQGNECSIAASGASPGPYCGNGASESSLYSAFGMPQGIQCNPSAPRCPFESTPTDGSGMFSMLGGSQSQALFCAPWSNWQGYGTTARPAKGGTAYYSGSRRRKIPPLYKNRAFFTNSGEPNATFCTAASTGATPGGKGLVQAGNPVTGTWTAMTTGTQKGGFNFASAPNNHAAGVRVGQGDFEFKGYWGHWKLSQGSARSGAVGEFRAYYPYVYSYTYATLRNDAGVFGPSKGPGSFNLVYSQGTQPIASINVRQGGAKFGGTMKMLGALKTNTCYYRNGDCSIGKFNWRYEAVGAPAYTYGDVVTHGYLATYRVYLYPRTLVRSTLDVEGLRFPWTTGSVTVTATGRGPHKTVHYAHGYDNRNTTTPSGLGTIQLVSPVLTRWLQPAINYETAGISILRIKFVPEPQTWVMLVAGVLFLGLGYRIRGR
jgi:hypothetical protein